MAVKLNLYMKSGVSEYWVVNLDEKSILQYSFSPERDIESLRSLKVEDTIESSVFAELKISLGDVFAEI